MRTGAWNTGWHHGRDFTQWTGSDAQKETLAAVEEQSLAVHAARAQAKRLGVEDDTVLGRELEEAAWRLLRAETSCNFYWGDAWVHRAETDLEASRQAVSRLLERMSAANDA